MERWNDFMADLIYATKEKTTARLDAFLGSASTLIACDQIDRTCYGIELEPKFVDVAVKRFAQQAGSTESISLLRDGKALRYDEVPGTAELSAVIDSDGEQDE